MVDAPLCKDCLHFRPASKLEYVASHDCGAIRTKAYVEPVTGTVQPSRFYHCWTMREVGRKCGPEGRLYKPTREAAQAIEARRAATTGAVHESAVGETDAPTTPSQGEEK